MPDGTMPPDEPRAPSPGPSGPESGPAPEQVVGGSPDRGGSVPPHAPESRMSPPPEAPTEEDVDAHLEETYNTINTEEVRELFERYGLKEDVKLSFRMQQLPRHYTPEQIGEHMTALNEAAEAHPDLIEAMARQTQAQQQQRAAAQASAERETDDVSAAPEPTGERETDETENGEEPRTAEDEERRRLEENELMQRAREAIDDSIKNPLDVQKREKAAHAIEHLKDHHDKDAKHGADYLQNVDPWWAKLLAGVGVSLYLYIGLQYAAASFVENATKGGK